LRGIGVLKNDDIEKKADLPNFNGILEFASFMLQYF